MDVFFFIYIGIHSFNLRAMLELSIVFFLYILGYIVIVLIRRYDHEFVDFRYSKINVTFTVIYFINAAVGSFVLGSVVFAPGIAFLHVVYLLADYSWMIMSLIDRRKTVTSDLYSNSYLFKNKYMNKDGYLGEEIIKFKEELWGRDINETWKRLIIRYCGFIILVSMFFKLNY